MNVSKLIKETIKKEVSFIKSNSKLIVMLMLVILLFGIGSSFASADVDDNVGVAKDGDLVSVGDYKETLNNAKTETISVSETQNNNLSSKTYDNEKTLTAKNSSNEDILSVDDIEYSTDVSELKNLINEKSGYIQITKNYDYGTNKIDTLVPLSNTVIDGQYHTIKGGTTNRLFNINNVNNVTIKNLNFIDSTGAFSQIAGGSTNIKIINVNVKNINYGDWGTLSRLYSSNNTLIKGCSAINVFSGAAGGAIYTSVEGDYVTIEDCSFEDCRATNRGGAIEFNSPNKFIYNCNFTNNKAGYNWAYAVSGGGQGSGVTALTTVNITFVIENCRFVNNTCTGTTGGAAILIETKSVAKRVEINDCVFINNSVTNSAANGGAVVFNADHSSMANCSFINNSAANTGGAIYSNAADCVIEDCSFEGNTAKDGQNYKIGPSGEIKFPGLKIDFAYVGNDDSTYDVSSGGGSSVDNAVSWASAEAFFKDGFVVHLINVTKWSQKTISQNNLTIVNVPNMGTIDLNYANRAFIINAENTNIKGLIIKNGNVTGNGGAIIWNGAEGTVEDCTFENNAAANGGAIYWAGVNGTILNSAFNKNTATANGGAVYFTGNNGAIESSTFTNNKAVYGSAVFLKNGVSNFELKDTTFTSNVASTSGTVAAEKLTTFSLGGNTFTSNTVASGDVDYYFYDNAPEITSALVYVSTTGSATSNGFTSSTPTTYAHAMQIIEEHGKIIFLNGEYDLGELTINIPIVLVGSGNTVFNSKNKNRYFTINADNVTVENIIFNNGKATGNGGAIVWNGAYGQVIGSTFTSNSATGSGGAIYWTGADGKIDKSTFTGNTGSNGNALSSTKTVSVSNSVLQNQITLSLTGNVNYGTDEVVTGTFQSNPASSVTLYFGDSSQGSLTVSSSKFSKSFSRLAVGTYTVGVKDSNGNTYTFTSGNTFTVNRLSTVYISPSGSGTGATSGSPTTWDKVADIITDSGTVVFTSGTYNSFYGKTISKSWTLKNSGTVVLDAASKGRFFTINADNVVIDGFTFQNGKVTTGSGGAIYNTGSGVTIKNSIFTGNSAPSANIIGSNKAITITNSQLKNPFTIATSNINWGSNEVITITFPTGTAPASGTIKLNNVDKGTNTVSNNQLQATISGLTVGSYVVTYLKGGWISV